MMKQQPACQLPPHVTLRPDYRTLLNLIARFSREIGLVILDQDYRPVWMNDLKARDYEHWAQRQPKTILDAKCYHIWNEFEAPCGWCPVTKTLSDGQLHLGRSASPDFDNPPSLKYSHIVSIPLAATAGPAQYVLEVIFFDKGETKRQLDALLALLPLADDLKRLLPKVNNPNLYADLVMLLLLTTVTANVSECDAYYSPAHPATDPETTFTLHRRLTRPMVATPAPEFIKELSAHPERLQNSWSRFFATAETGAFKLSQLTHAALQHAPSPVDWVPQRLSPNSFAFYLPWPAPTTSSAPVWCIIARNDKKNSFLVRDDLTRVTLFLSALRRHIEVLWTTRAQEKQIATLERKIKLLDTSDLLDAVPFALGKKHELAHLVAVQKLLLKQIDDLRLPSDRRALLTRCTAGLKSVTNALANLQRTFGTLQDLQQHHFQAVDIKELLDRVLSYTAALSQIRMDRRIDYQLPAKQRAHADAALLEQVFFNLISNAVKALALVSYRARALVISVRPTGGGAIEIEFADNGIGVEDDKIQKIFERHVSFFPQGTGLGLYYCKKIVELHKGTITFTSVWGQGSQVKVTVPKAG